MPAKKKNLRNRALGLEALPDHVLADIDKWLIERGLGYEQVVAKLKEKHGRSTSGAALSCYFKRHFVRLTQAPGTAPCARFTVAGVQITITVTPLPAEHGN